MSQASSIANDASMLSVGLRKPAWPSRRETEVPTRQDRDTEAASWTSRSSNRTTTTVDPQDTSSRLLMARTIQSLQDKIDEQKETIGQQKDEIASLALDSVQHKHLIQDLERENDELKATFPPEGSRRAHNYREVGQLLEELEETRRAYETGKAEAARAKTAFEQHLAVLSESERTLSDKLRHAHTELRECKAALAMSERKRKALKADLGELYQATQVQSEKSTRQEKEAEKYEERLVHERMQSKETLEVCRRNTL
jgi:DNA repair exonuclease SbcCD ATPase subunit